MGKVGLQKSTGCKGCEECKRMLGPDGEEGPGGQFTKTLSSVILNNFRSFMPAFLCLWRRGIP